MANTCPTCDLCGRKLKPRASNSNPRTEKCIRKLYLGGQKTGEQEKVSYFKTIRRKS